MATRAEDEGLAYIASNVEPYTKSCEAHAQERDDMEDALTAALARIAELEAENARLRKAVSMAVEMAVSLNMDVVAEHFRIALEEKVEG